MEIQDKIKHEAPNEIRLYREGLFWVAYEQSAFLLSKLKKLKPTLKKIKKLGTDVVSVGFPDSVLQSLLPSMKVQESADNLIVCRSDTAASPAEFLEWKNAIEQPLKTLGNADPLVEKIRRFDLSSTTPLQAMLFLAELKKEIECSQMPK
jgi:hypothetical protein